MSKHDHDRSEIWERADLLPRIRQAMQFLSVNLKIIRSQKHISQENLAGLCGLHPKHIQRLERGTVANTTLATMVALAAALDTELEAFFKRQ